MHARIARTRLAATMEKLHSLHLDSWAKSLPPPDRAALDTWECPICGRSLEDSPKVDLDPFRSPRAILCSRCFSGFYRREMTVERLAAMRAYLTAARPFDKWVGNRDVEHALLRQKAKGKCSVKGCPSFFGNKVDRFPASGSARGAVCGEHWTLLRIFSTVPLVEAATAYLRRHDAPTAAVPFEGGPEMDIEDW